MRHTQFLIFEVGTGCNLKHKECPCYAQERYTNVDTSQEMSDDMIVEVAVRMHEEFGFQGLIGWHYYNEPMLYRKRVRRLMARIKEKVPKARFVLWTNGQLLEGHKDLAGFEMVRITDYEGSNYGWAREAASDVRVMRWKLDGRLKALKGPSDARCRRMFTEFVIDFYGNVHICCIDWKGDVEVGNVMKNSLDGVVERFLVIRDSMSYRMNADAPQVCRRCALRTQEVDRIERNICRQTNVAINEGGLGCSSKIAVVCYSYNGVQPGKMWMDSIASFGEYRGMASNIRGVNQMFREAASDGFSEGMVLWPDDIVRNVDELKKSVGMRALPVGQKCDGEFVMTVMLKDFMHYHRAVPVYKNAQGKCGVTKHALVERIGGVVKSDTTAVVFVCHKIPERRLMEHFEWNDAFYRISGVKVFIVADKDYDFVPDYAKCLVYPDEMPVFNLSATSNFGIRYAIDSGFERVVKTDVDINYTDGSWREMLRVDDGRGVVPLYRMVGSYKKRNTDFSPDGGATGTIAMTSGDWKKAHFNENCVGYGADDKILLMAMRDRGILVDECVNRNVMHIAHVADTSQNNKGERSDYWNRDNGYNPRNNVGNNLFSDKPVYDHPKWGLASWSDVAVVIAVSSRDEVESAVKKLDSLHEQEGVRLIVICSERFEGFGENVRFLPYGSEVGGLVEDEALGFVSSMGIEGMKVWMGALEGEVEVAEKVKRLQLGAS